MVLPGCNHSRSTGNDCRGSGNLHRGRGRNKDYPEAFSVHQLEAVDASRVGVVDGRCSEWLRNILRMVLGAVPLAVCPCEREKTISLRVGNKTGPETFSCSRSKI